MVQLYRKFCELELKVMPKFPAMVQPYRMLGNPKLELKVGPELPMMEQSFKVEEAATPPGEFPLIRQFVKKEADMDWARAEPPRLLVIRQWLRTAPWTAVKWMAKLFAMVQSVSVP